MGRIHKEVHKHGVYKRGKSFFLIRALMLLDLKIWDQVKINLDSEKK